MKWFTVEEKTPKQNFDYLVLKEDSTMAVSKGCTSENGVFKWDTSGNVFFYRKLPNRPKGFCERSLKKGLKEEVNTTYCSFYDIFPGFKEYMENEYGKGE